MEDGHNRIEIVHCDVRVCACGDKGRGCYLWMLGYRGGVGAVALG